MAGAGFKLFSNNSVLTAQEVNTYMMEQMVMVFSGTAARGSALPSPSEGMHAYLTDSNSFTFYDGSTWRNV